MREVPFAAHLDRRSIVFFDAWQGLGRVVTVGVLAYAALVLVLRVAGNRTLSKLNAFDFVVTVGLGSTLATILLNKDVVLVEGIVAFSVLVGLQYAVSWTSVRWSFFSKLVTSEPILVVHRGQFLRDAMRRARIMEAEILAVLRGQGVARIEDVHTVVLESDGSLSVVAKTADAGPEPSTLGNVEVESLVE
jgi:uncharacterized membrane protein YcaP (DUF421 family)